MLHDFLTAHRTELVKRCREKVALRVAPCATDAELAHGITFFLDQLIKTLKVEQTRDASRSREVSGSSGGGELRLSEIGSAASRHGKELLDHGFTIDQVVHDYGDLCQAITELASDLEEPFETEEFKTLNRCLDNAIADAVTEFSYFRDFAVAENNAASVNERLGFFAHELRNLLNSATLALTAIKGGGVGLNGATGAVLDRSLVGLRNLIDRSLSDVRLTAGLPIPRCLFSVADFITEVRHTVSLEADVKGCGLTVAPVDADRDLISSAVGNLLQNAFKFTEPRTEVRLNAYAVADRVRIDIEDHCGGLPKGDAEKMFLPSSRAATTGPALVSASRSRVRAWSYSEAP